MKSLALVVNLKRSPVTFSLTLGRMFLNVLVSIAWLLVSSAKWNGRPFNVSGVSTEVLMFCPN